MFARGPFKPVFNGLVLHPESRGPAAKADIRPGDIVTKVDGVDVIGLDWDEVLAKKLRGPVNTPVTLTVKRDGKELPPKTLTRAVIIPDDVYSVDLGNGIYSIVIKQFNVNTSFRWLDEMQRLDPVAKGWVFDLRNNGGGILDEGIQSVLWLIHDGTIFSQRERIEGDPTDPQYRKISWTRVGPLAFKTVINDKSGKVLEKAGVSFYEADPTTGAKGREFKEQPFLLASGKPAVVLANAGTASAGEIVTAGLAENCIGDEHCVDASGKQAEGKPQGAVFIGKRTHGKGIGQAIQPGPEEDEAKGPVGMKMTTFRYYTPHDNWPGNAWTIKTGLTPQIEVDQPDDAILYMSSDRQLWFAKEYLLSGGKAKPPGQ